MIDRAPTPNLGRGLTWNIDEDDEPIIRRDPQFENLIAQLIPRQKGKPTALLEVVGHSEGMIAVRPPDAEGMEPFGAHSASGLHVEPGDLVLAVQVEDTWYLLDSVTDSLAYGFGEGPFGESAFGGATGGSGDVLTQGKADTLYADKSRVDPGVAGTNGQVLGIASGAPTWLANQNLRSTTTTTVSITLDATVHDVVEVDATGGLRVLTLPALASNQGVEFTAVKTDTSTNQVQIDPSATERISGMDRKGTTSQWGSLTFHAGATQWIVTATTGTIVDTP